MPYSRTSLSWSLQNSVGACLRDSGIFEPVLLGLTWWLSKQASPGDCGFLSAALRAGTKQALTQSTLHEALCRTTWLLNPCTQGFWAVSMGIICQSPPPRTWMISHSSPPPTHPLQEVRITEIWASVRPLEAHTADKGSSSRAHSPKEMEERELPNKQGLHWH